MIVIEKRVEEKKKMEITTDFLSYIRSLLMFIMSHPLSYFFLIPLTHHYSLFCSISLEEKCQAAANMWG